MLSLDPGFGVYVHWPFCLSKCPYCDFNSHVRENVDHTAWKTALLREIDYYAEKTPGRQVTSIFFGGGTPSLMEPDTVGAVIDHIAKRWDVGSDIEITLEANPTSVEAGKFAAFARAGVNRTSLGVQALNDNDLKALGREHSAQEALDALNVAEKYFSRFSFDLIYARPDQDLKSWQAELKTALDLGASHMSLYQLTIEPGTAFYTLYQRGDLKVPDSDKAADLYEATQEQMQAAGLPAYEISNHARTGEESQHNLTYWRYGDYVGVGPGAHGRLTLDGKKHATRAHRAPEVWLDRVMGHGHGAHDVEDISTEQRVQELLMMGLRLHEGVAFSRIVEEGGCVDTLTRSAKFAHLRDAGFVANSNDAIMLTPKGQQCLDAVLAEILL